VPATGAVVVLIVAAGADWESTALARLGAHPGIVVLKRCVDVDDLLATASSGQADVAVLGLDSHGLDVAAVDHLRAHGVRPVVVAPVGTTLDVARLRATRIGVHGVVEAGSASGPMAGLVEEVLAHDPDPDTVLPPTQAGTPAPGERWGSLAVPSTSTPGRVVAVWGPAGAPGRTTVAAGLAAELGRRGLRTVLVDADPQGGTLSQTLGVLDEVSGLLTATRLAVAGELGAQFASVQRALDDRLTLVSGLPRADRWTEVRAGTVTSVLDQARRHGHVVVDTGASLEEDPAADFGSRPARQAMTLEALGAADEVVAVGTPDPVGLARLARGLADLASLDLTAPVRVVVNRMRPTLGWSQRDVTEMVGRFAGGTSVHVLPDDRAIVDRALVAGRTLVETAPDAALPQALLLLADELVGGGMEP
jgi:MinD-like ATPase involved in chromosome partitioning or flagellar assembly